MKKKKAKLNCSREVFNFDYDPAAFFSLIALFKVHERNDWSQTFMICPKCWRKTKGKDPLGHSHIESIAIQQGKLITTITGDNVVTTVHGYEQHRGSRVAIVFFGECDHHWALKMHFHKGETEATFVLFPDVPDGIECPELWRD